MAEVPGIGLPEEKTGMDGRRDHDSDEETINVPSEEDLHTLRRVPARIPWICFTIAFVELCERFAYYGTTAVSKSATVKRRHTSVQPRPVTSRS